MPRGIPNQHGQSDPDETPKVDETPEAETPKAETPESKPEAKAETKVETHAQKARKEAEAAQAEAEKDELDRAESFSVIFPTGISVPAEDGVHEVKATVGGREVWIDAENGFVHLPKGALIRASSLVELEDLRQKAMFRFVEAIAPEAAH